MRLCDYTLKIAYQVQSGPLRAEKCRAPKLAGKGADMVHANTGVGQRPGALNRYPDGF